VSLSRTASTSIGETDNELDSRPEITYAGEIWRRLLASNAARVGFVVIGLFILLGLFAPLISPYDPIGQELVQRLKGPSAAHLFGTDNLGRDVLSRVLFGARISLQVGVLAVALGLVFGTLLGVISGYFSGWVDTIIMRAMDIMLAFPGTLLAIAIVAARGPGLGNTMVAIGVIQIPIYARIVRGAVLVSKEREFVNAALALGSGHVRIMLRHILPNSLAPIIVQATLGFATAVIEAAALGFLGLGAQPPDPEWGAMLADGYKYLVGAPWALIFPGGAIMLTVLGFNLLGDGLRDALDPRTR
jgi:peptide/nickel transport system permease protein